MIVTLKDITTKITKGTTPTSIGCKFEKSGINFIKSESLVDGKTIDKSKFAFISERTHERLKRSQIEENDILFSMAGMFLGKTGIATAEVVPANTNQAVAIIRVDDTKANYEYVYYYLNQKSVIHTINTTSAQSAQPNINLKQIGKIKINLPDRKKQDQIVSLLSAIDLKISNNVEINDNLLSIIQRNYFVISNLNNERLVRQSGSFLISGKYNVQLKGKIRQSIVKRAYSDVQDEFELQSFRIPAGRKSAILEELSFYNINEGTLFPELEHQMAYIKSNYANIQKPMADRFVKIEVPVTNIREVCDLDISDDKVDEIIQRVLRDEINPAFFDESYIAIQENLMPDWYRKEIGLSKVRLALTDTLDNGTPIGRAMAKRAAQSIVEKIVNAIAQESNTATSDNS